MIRLRFVFVLLIAACISSYAFPTAAPSFLGSPAYGQEHGAAPQPKAEAVHGPEKGGHAEEPGMFDINWGILISQTLNFFILLFVLNKLLYGPINSIVEERRNKIQQTLQSAEKEKTDALALKADYEGRLAVVDKETYQMKQKAISEARQAEEDIVKKAKEAAGKLTDKAQKDITLERQKAWLQLREDVVKLALSCAEKVIDKSLDDPTHHEIVKKAIAEIEATK